MSARGVPAGEPPDEPDLDAEWKDIVARLGDLSPAPDDETEAGTEDPDAPTGRRPVNPRRRQDDRPGSRVVRPADGPGTPEPAGPAEPGPAGSDPRGWVPDPEVERAEEQFVPPDPGPVLGGDPVLTMAWIAVLGVPLFVLVSLLAWQDVPTWVLQACGAVLLAGIGVLLWRMPHRRSDDDDDTGAVV